MSSEANLLDWYLPAFAVESSHPSKFSHGVMLVFSMFLAYILAGGIYRGIRLKTLLFIKFLIEL